jgi:hypothetical protein
MQEANVADAVKTIFQRSKRTALREEHEDSVETLVQIRVSFWFE